MFEKVLIANRGEISIRVARALREMGIGSVAVYSEIERDAPHVREANEAFLLGPATPSESYLNVEKILEIASSSGAEAIHPGYGFLAENAPFAAAVEGAELTWIGPPPKAIEAMGSKTEARQIMDKAGVPIVPGATSPVKDVAAAKKQAQEIGYPIACKAAGGGGGKGFRVAQSEDEMEEAFEGASREGEKFFSDPTVYLERYLEDPRHVEVQVLADAHGNVVHLFEREIAEQWGLRPEGHPWLKPVRRHPPDHAARADDLRPFDRERKGLSIGEAAGILVFEEWERAKRRGAPILAEFLGYDAWALDGISARAVREVSGGAGASPERSRCSSGRSRSRCPRRRSASDRREQRRAQEGKQPESHAAGSLAF